MKSALAIVAAGLFLMTPAVAEPKPKVTICHFDEEEAAWVTITVSEPAAEAHIAHHDDAALGGQTSQSGTILDSSCQPL